jgi:type VI secretion system FHA domain protein
MAAAPAMRDAYVDLRAHQFGMVAGMRAALEGVLDRFDPAELEGRLTQRSMLQSLLSGSRKAKLWEMFVEHSAQIRAEAADDFQTLFGSAFLQAYEAHIDQLDREGT